MLSEEIRQAAAQFASNLRLVPVVGAFVAAEEAFQTDEELRAQRERFNELVQRFQRARMNGTLTDELVAEVRRAQARLQSHPLVMEYGRKRQEALAFLQETNARMSAILGVDFAAIARPPSTC